MEHNKELFLKKFKRIPSSIPLLVSLICIYGFILLYSAAGGHIAPWASKQITIFSIFMPISILIAMLDLRLIYNISYAFYLLTFILLIIVEFTGKSAMGATRWIDLGIFTIQPSELVKISIVLMLAKYFNESSKYNFSNYSMLIPIIASIIPIALVVKQPDLGTGIITIIVVITMFFAAGIRLAYFIISGILGLTAMPLIWIMMHNYQRNRILTFLDPERDPLGAGYNIIQSKIAIGSGGLFGKGLLSGTQSQLNFLPEHQTDFIFAFLTEELGFVGGVILLILYSILIISSLRIAINCRAKFAKLMVIGITTLFFCHIFINIAMVMGLLPAVGIPLPLVSYGRTMMVSMLIGFGLIMNAAVNQRNNI
ncbi:MAG: rod shape-determining protein RodA [Rickettsiaceae bacterium]|nr:rod shape-determining protein RodA [Rickettsiaceae bacterium]MDP4833012.1 rod shape-determining protein RodA [Rickettsiaceae bacterium]MDP5020635.1 rod shape-determining protein RodA [Rickettsiaceae bacterium]MDP5083020.1 rod shape-determining protein RodA [Rickettsiaceae bacterium]